MNVFFIDDDSTSLECLSSALRLQGHVVQAYSTIESALRKFTPDAADVVICDFHFPTGTGMDVLNRVKELSPATPVIIISGDPERNVEKECLKKGASAFFKKPLSISKLLDKMKEITPGGDSQ